MQDNHRPLYTALGLNLFRVCFCALDTSYTFKRERAARLIGTTLDLDLIHSHNGRADSLLLTERSWIISWLTSAAMTLGAYFLIISLFDHHGLV